MTTDARIHQPPCPASSPNLTAEHTDDESQLRPTMRKGWARIWPSLLAAVTLPAVGGPAAVASYRHARDVITEHGDPMMAPWLALTTDGMLLAALVVIWVRRHRREPVGARPSAVTGLDNRAPKTPETAASDQPGRDIGTDRRHAVDERPAADLDCLPGAAPAATAPATNGHVPLRIPTSPTPDPRDSSAPAGSAAPASKHRPTAVHSQWGGDDIRGRRCHGQQKGVLQLAEDEVGTRHDAGLALDAVIGPEQHGAGRRRGPVGSSGRDTATRKA